jgi:hypothetical protein
MNPLHFVVREARRRARPRALAVVAALSLSIACGSSEGGQRSTDGGAAGASASGAGSGSDAAGHNGGGAAGASGGANGGFAGASAGSSGASGAAAGAQGSGGKGGAGAGGATGGGGGATGGGGGVTQLMPCPEKPPGPSESCNSDGVVCSYEDCAGAGRTVTTCGRLGGARLTWSTRTAACGAVQCLGLPSAMSCTSGQICSVSVSGTIGGMCAQSSCGTGPVTCACAHASCTDCAVSGSAEQGFTVTCNNCPQGGCP